jgi:predicted NBD/HSP70 family sugar kinase
LKIIGNILSLNQRKLVDLVFRNEGMARIDLTHATQMTGASVTRLTADLEDFGLFEQKVDKSGARGQPKKILSIRRHAFKSVGVYLYLDRMVAVIIDFTGQVLGKTSRPTNDRTAQGAMRLAVEMANELVEITNTDADSFIGIGLTLPGNFGTYGSHLKAHETFEEFEGYQFQNGPTDFEGAQFHIENDGTAAALGEYLFGRREPRDPLFLIHIGYGLGGGAVMDGRPFRGHNGNACLPGALFPYSGPRPTLQDFQEEMGKAGIDLNAVRKLSADTVLENDAVMAWITRASDQMRFAIQVISGMFDLEIIVLGGALPVAVTNELVAMTNASPVSPPSRGLEAAPVVATRLGELNGPIGAASIPFFRTFFPGSS